MRGSIVLKGCAGRCQVSVDKVGGELYIGDVSYLLPIDKVCSAPDSGSACEALRFIHKISCIDRRVRLMGLFLVSAVKITGRFLASSSKTASLPRGPGPFGQP